MFVLLEPRNRERTRPMSGNFVVKYRCQKTALSLTGLCVALLYTVVLSGCISDGPQTRVGGPVDMSNVTSEPSGPVVADLNAVFNGWGYTLASVQSGQTDVPRVMLSSVPQGKSTVTTRKSVFIRAVLPLVLMENERILADRDRLLLITARQDKGRVVSSVDLEWLDRLADTYKVKRGNLEELTRRVDAVPPSLALAQAAEESGWGTSRFAREGNALYGQWTTSAAKSIVPKGRQAGKTHTIKAFETPGQAVASYMRNLNTHRAYKALRAIRVMDRARGVAPSGSSLSHALSKYSQRGQDYIHSLQAIINVNKLTALDAAKLKRRGGPIQL